MSAEYADVNVPLGHPLLPSGSTYARIKEHRLVLWKKIGPGTHPCHYCSQPVTWSPGRKTRRGALVVDHVDYNKRNNAPDNLVPSCHPCNTRRKGNKRREPSGRRMTEIRCEECLNLVVVVANKNRTQRFCSRVCLGRNVRRQTVLRRGGVHTSRSIAEGELFVYGTHGRTRAKRKVCETCGADYLVANAAAAKRRFCSPPCRYKMERLVRSNLAGRCW
jgi:endogenous inhibitor of DNA gyrase (YacG/DUF329 family)